MLSAIYEDLSDCEFEGFMSGNNAAQWFESFCLTEKRPDYSTICQFRNTIGCKQVANIFAAEVFAFIDVTALTSKLTMWVEAKFLADTNFPKLTNLGLCNINSVFFTPVLQVIFKSKYAS